MHKKRGEKVLLENGYIQYRIWMHNVVWSRRLYESISKFFVYIILNIPQHIHCRDWRFLQQLHNAMSYSFIRTLILLDLNITASFLCCYHHLWSCWFYHSSDWRCFCYSINNCNNSKLPVPQPTSLLAITPPILSSLFMLLLS